MKSGLRDGVQTGPSRVNMKAVSTAECDTLDGTATEPVHMPIGFGRNADHNRPGGEICLGARYAEQIAGSD